MKRGITFGIVLILTIPVFANDIWLHMLTSGQPATTKYLGDYLNSSGTWYINFEIGQASWYQSDAGIGKSNTDVSSWTWKASVWYENGFEPNKRVCSDFSDFQFTSTGNWYFAGRAKAESGDAFHYANNVTWGNSSTFAPEYYFTVNALNNPTAGTFTAHINSIDLSWSKDAQLHNVMIIRITDSQSFTEPTQGINYSVGNTIGSGVVVYNGSGTSTTDNGLSENTEYVYKLYSENNSYYSSGVEVTSTSTLPVELSSFTANTIGNEINLNWKTATEVNNYGFNVERRTKSEKWRAIGFVNGSGNSNSPKEYSFTDKTAAADRYIYRLKQIDNDGQFKYSPEVEVAVNNIIDGYILEQNYPNPFNPTTSIKFGFNDDTEVNLLVFDQVGNQVATLFNGKAQAGRIYNVEFNAAGLASGIYFYKLETPNKNEVRKMLLIK